jgi:hypothetical protein
MKTAAELRAEAARLLAFAHSVNETEVLKGVRAMIAELERRARMFGNGDGGGR